MIFFFFEGGGGDLDLKTSLKTFELYQNIFL